MTEETYVSNPNSNLSNPNQTLHVEKMLRDLFSILTSKENPSADQDEDEPQEEEVVDLSVDRVSETELEQLRGILMSVTLELSDSEQSSKQAVEASFSADDIPVVQLAVRFLKLKHTQLPSAADVVGFLLDVDVSERNVLLEFKSFVSSLSRQEQIELFGRELDDVMVMDEREVSDDRGEERNTEQGEGQGQESEGAPPPGPLQRALRRSQRRELLQRALRCEQSLLFSKSHCVLCMTSPAQVTFLPCSHFQMCLPCADSVTSCPVCQTHIHARVKTFIM